MTYWGLHDRSELSWLIGRCIMRDVDETVVCMHGWKRQLSLGTLHNEAALRTTHRHGTADTRRSRFDRTAAISTSKHVRPWQR